MFYPCHHNLYICTDQESKSNVRTASDNCFYDSNIVTIPTFSCNQVEINIKSTPAPFSLHRVHCVLGNNHTPQNHWITELCNSGRSLRDCPLLLSHYRNENSYFCWEHPPSKPCMTLSLVFLTPLLAFSVQSSSHSQRDFLIQLDHLILRLNSSQYSLVTGWLNVLKLQHSYSVWLKVGWVGDTVLWRTAPSLILVSTPRIWSSWTLDSVTLNPLQDAPLCPSPSTTLYPLSLYLSYSFAFVALSLPSPGSLPIILQAAKITLEGRYL